MKKSIIIVAATIFLIAGCSKNFLDVNTSPNSPSTIENVSLVLPAAIGSAAYIFGGQLQILGGFWAQHWTQSPGAGQYQSNDKYSMTVESFNRDWNELYSGSLNDLEWIKLKAETNQNWTYYFVANTMQCYIYQMLADLYDQIPFSEALKGVPPKWDAGVDVYNGLISRLNYAATLDLTASTCIKPGADDLLFNGDMDKWIRFANTLKLKIYLRQWYAIAASSDSIKNMFSDPNIKFLDVDARMSQFTDESNRGNPVYETEFRNFGNKNVCASTTLLKFLDDNQDPRLDKIYKAGSGGQKGLDQGDFNNKTVDATSLSKPKLSATDAVYFMTKAESLFLQAEANLRGLGNGTDETLYQNGIDAAFERIDTIEASDTYAPGQKYEYKGDFDTKLKSIITQKWISMANIQGLEAFFEYNRTGYPTFTLSKTSVLKTFPKRLYFPQSETNTNPNTPINVADITIPVWWDK